MGTSHMARHCASHRSYVDSFNSHHSQLLYLITILCPLFIYRGGRGSTHRCRGVEWILNQEI